MFHPNKKVASDGLPSDRTNNQKADAAANALDAYGDGFSDPDDGTFSVLLADLMHYCDREDMDFDHELAKARMHHDAEK